MTTFRKCLERLVGNDFDLSKTNASLWLDKFIFDSTKEGKGSRNNDETAKAEIVREVTQEIIEPLIYNTYFEKIWQSKLHNFGAKCRNAKVKNRLAINLGSESVLETSIALNRVFGTPFIPGSALKGLVSHFLHQYGGSEWKKETSHIKQGDYHAVVFGNQDNAGFVTFYDALYIPNTGFNGKSLYSDVMTTHHPGYYGEKNDESKDNDILPPADWDSPNPVPFISATGEYLIALSGPQEWVELMFDILGHALEIEGVGAKTSSGYGRMNLQDHTDTYTDRYKIQSTSHIAGEVGSPAVADERPTSESERIAQGLIQRIRALQKIKVAGDIPQLAKECFAIESNEAKKEVADVIVETVIWANRFKASEGRPWFQRVVSITKGAEIIGEETASKENEEVASKEE